MHLICWKSLKNYARITNSVRPWPSIIWLATIGALEKWEPHSISCREPSQLNRAFKDQKSKLTHILISALCFHSWTSTNWLSTMQWARWSCFRKWCLQRGLTQVLSRMRKRSFQLKRPKTELQCLLLHTITWESNRSSSDHIQPQFYHIRKQLILLRRTWVQMMESHKTWEMCLRMLKLR